MGEDPKAPESGGGESSTGQRGVGLRRGLVGLSILIVAIGAFLLLQGGDEDGPTNAIAAAAQRTEEEPGGRAVMHTVVSSPGEPALTMTGHMAYDAEERGRGVVTVPASDSKPGMGLDMVTDGDMIYLHSSRFGPLPEGRRWMGIDLSVAAGMPDSSVPVGGDPKGELGILEAFDGEAQKLGKEDVRGVATTRYRGTVAPPKDADAESPPPQLEVWIDAEGLVRRMRFISSGAGEGEGPSTTDMTIEFFDFGFEPVIEVPDPDEVFDATELAQS